MALIKEDLEKVLEYGIDTENCGKYKNLLNDLQGNILKGHGREHSIHLFLQFKQNKRNLVKEWIKSFAKTYVKSAKQQASDAVKYRREGISAGVFANLFLSCRGYEYLEIESFKIPTDQPFRFGMKNEVIREYLGDPNVKEWEKGFQNTIHALVLIADDYIIELLQKVNQITQELRQVAEIVHREDGFILRNEDGNVIEHFGFVDGVSQPLFFKRDIIKDKVNHCDFSKWDPRAPLNLVLTKDPNGQTEDSYGSYLVYRKLEQDVKCFREDKRYLAQKLNITEDLVGAYIMGRFQDGTPVTESDIPINADNITNNFNYNEDQRGTKCPFHAHIRKTNPRGDTARLSHLDFDEGLKQEKDHRIVRRAVSYGENDVKKEPEKNSGLLFLCFQADIESQYNFIQIRWSNQVNFVNTSVGPDPLIGQPEGKQQWTLQWGKDGTNEQPFRLWVSMKGGEYFFAPSISFLTNLS